MPGLVFQGQLECWEQPTEPVWCTASTLRPRGENAYLVGKVPMHEAATVGENGGFKCRCRVKGTGYVNRDCHGAAISIASADRDSATGERHLQDKSTQERMDTKT